MRIGIVTLPNAGSEGSAQAVVGRIAALAAKAEELGFEGLWMTDSLGRGRPTLDPLIALAALCSATKRIELGTCVLQVPLRAPADLAHRAHSLDVISNGRLRLGIGTGSTQADFDVLGADYKARFKTLPASLADMRRIWRGEAVHAAPLQIWPGSEGRPHVMLGAWRNPKWIEMAATQCEGWIASGIHSKWEDLERGIGIYRAAGGKRAIVANIFTDLRAEPQVAGSGLHAQISLVCTPAVARERLQRLAALGFDDALLVAPPGPVDQLEAIRDLM